MSFLSIRSIGKGIYDNMPFVPESVKMAGRAAAGVAYKFCATLVHPVSPKENSVNSDASFPIVSVFVQHHFSPQANTVPAIKLYQGWTPSYEGLSSGFESIGSTLTGLSSGFESIGSSLTFLKAGTSRVLASLAPSSCEELDAVSGCFLFSNMVSFEDNMARQSSSNYKNHLRAKLGPSAAYFSKRFLRFVEGNVENNSVSLNLKSFVKANLFDPEVAVMEQILYIEGLLKETSPREFLYVLWEINEFIQDYMGAKEYIQERKFEDLSLNTVQEERKAWIEGFAGKWHVIIPEDPKDYEKALDAYLETLFSKFGKILYGPNVHVPFKALMRSMGSIGLTIGFQSYFVKEASKVSADAGEIIYIELFEVLEGYAKSANSFKEIGELEPSQWQFPENLILIDFIGGTQVVRACSKQARELGIRPGMEACKAQYLYDSKMGGKPPAELKYRNQNPELFRGYYSIEEQFGKLIQAAPKYLFLSLRKELLKTPLIGIPLLVALRIVHLLLWPLRRLASTAFSDIPSLEDFGRDFASNFLFLLRFPGFQILGVRVVESFLNCFANKNEKVQYEPFPIEDPKKIFFETFSTIHKLALSFFPKISKLNQNIFIRYSAKASFWMLKKCCILTIKLIDSPLGYLALKIVKKSLCTIPRMRFIGKTKIIDENHDFIEDAFLFLKKTCRILNSDRKTDIEKLKDTIVLFFEEAAKLGLVQPDLKCLEEASDPLHLFQETFCLFLKGIGEYFDPEVLSWNQTRIALKKRYLQAQQEISKGKQQILRLSTTINKLKKKAANYEAGAFHHELIKDFSPVREVETSIKRELAYLADNSRKNKLLIEKYETFHQKLISENGAVGGLNKWLKLVKERISACEEIQQNNRFRLKDEEIQQQLHQLYYFEQLLKIASLCQRGNHLIRQAEQKKIDLRDLITDVKKRLKAEPENERRAVSPLKKEITDLVRGIKEIEEPDHLLMVDFLLLPDRKAERTKTLSSAVLTIKAWSKDLREYYQGKLTELKEKEDGIKLLSDNLETFLLPADFFQQDLTQEEQNYLKNFLNQFDTKELNKNISFAAKKRLEGQFDLYPHEKAKAAEGRLIKAKEDLERIRKENKIYFESVLEQNDIKQKLNEYLKDNRSIIRKMYDCVFNLELGFLHDLTCVDPKEKQKELFVKGMNFLKEKHPDLLKSRFENENKLKWQIFDLKAELLDLENRTMDLNHFDIPWWLSLSGQETFDQLLPRVVYYAEANGVF